MSKNNFASEALPRGETVCARAPAVRQVLVVAACLLLLSWSDAKAGCFGFSTTPGTCPPGSSFNAAGQPQVSDPPIALHEPHFEAGATLTVRGAPAPALGNASGFVRTGVTVPIDAASTAELPNVGTVVATSGQATLRENVSVPIVGGVSVPAKTFGVPIPNLSFEAFAGAELKGGRFSFNLTEAGLPGSAAASSTYSVLDPVVGIGVQYMLGTVGYVPVSLGVNGTYDFPTQQQTISAASPNFPGTTYVVTGPERPNLALGATLNFDLMAK